MDGDVRVSGRRVAYAPVRPSLVGVEVQRLDRGHDALGYGPHAHEFFEVIVFDVAGGAHVVEGAATPVRAGQAWMLRPGVFHDLARLGDAEGWLVVAGPEALGLPAGVGDVLPWPAHPLVLPFQQVDAFGRPRSLALDRKRLKRWTGWLTQIATETADARLGYQHAVRALLQLLLIDAARDATSVGTLVVDPLVERALAVVDERFRGPLSLADVARELAVTPGHLTESVRRRSGRPVGQWILQRRLAEARLLLAESTRPIQAVSAECGFGDVGQFSRQFRRHHGMSPSAWRAFVTGAAGADGD
jgi:AraC family transcriptional regulator, transcriptional activator of pobA